MKNCSCFLLLIVCSFFTIQSCQKDADLVDNQVIDGVQSYTNVPASMWEYFQRFEEEGLERGYVVDLNAQNISAEIREISEDGVAGSCSYGSHTPGHIVIDQTFWNQASDLFREMVIFHELGHCSLFRGHSEATNANGTCQSIMRSGTGSCRDNYRFTTREGYLDELFENTGM